MAKRGGYSLDQSRLYMVTSPEDLAARLKVSIADLQAYVADEGNYKIWLTSKGRQIQEPRAPIQKVHAEVHKFISRIKAPEYLHSGVKGHSYISNAAAHMQPGSVIKIDIKKFYQSVPKAAIHRFFHFQMKCAEHVAGLLASLLSVNGHLPTGSSSSPIISYYAFKDLFDEIAEVANRNGLTMTCYVDDITLSGPKANAKLLHEIRQIIARYGLTSHKAKCFQARRPKIITGVTIAKGRMVLPNRRQFLIKQQYDMLLAASEPSEKLEILKSLTSRVHEAAQIDPRWLGKAKALEKLRNELKRKLLISKIDATAC